MLYMRVANVHTHTHKSSTVDIFSQYTQKNWIHQRDDTAPDLPIGKSGAVSIGKQDMETAGPTLTGTRPAVVCRWQLESLIGIHLLDMKPITCYF